MTLPSLKKLRTTARRVPSTITRNNASPAGGEDRPVRSRLHWLIELKNVATLLVASAIGLGFGAQLDAQISQAQTHPGASRIATAAPQEDYLVAKQKYEAALKAQLLRAQSEQGAPAGFADRAFAATKAYLDETEEKSYGPGAKLPPRHTAQQATRYQQVPKRTPMAARRTPMLPPNQPVTRVPVHVAPQANSTVPVPRQVPQTNRMVRQSTPRPENARLQDRLAAMLKGNQRQTQPATPAYRQPTQRTAPQQAQPQPLYQPQLQASNIPAQPVKAIGSSVRTNMQTSLQTNELNRSQVVTAAATAPPEAPLKLAGPQEFDNVQFRQSSQPLPAPRNVLPNSNQLVANPISMAKLQQSQSVVSKNRMAAPRMATPKLMGSQGSYPKPKQISVLMNNRSPRLQEQDNGNAFPGNRPAINQPTPINQPVPTNQEAIEALPKTRPVEDQTPAAGVTQEPSANVQQQLRDMEDRRRQVEASQDDDDTRDPLEDCNDMQNRLLGRSIRDIALDISPPASRIRDQYVAISRSWTDRTSNIIATGTMVDLRRGYVIIETQTGLQKIPYAKLSDADWRAVAEYWRIPELCGIGDKAIVPRMWTPQTVTWHASALCHKPLYFENRQLERYGHTHGPVLQPIHSTAHFFVSLFSLPYQTAIHPPSECMYALGYYRPGNCAPWLKDPVPISLDGLRRQALITTGLAFIP